MIDHAYKSYKEKERRTETNKEMGEENTIFGQGVIYFSVSAFSN